MTHTTIAALILIATVIMFFSSTVPNTIAAIVGTVAMGVSGILPVKTVFNYYSSSTCVLMIGMMIRVKKLKIYTTLSLKISLTFAAASREPI